MTFPEVVATLRYGLRNLFRFSGRDGRRLFWPWGLCVVGLVYTVNAALAQGTVLSGILRVFDASRRGGDETGRAFADIFAQIEALWIPFAVSEAVAVGLLAGAVARRLHDGGWSGAWGLLPLPLLALGIWQMPGAFNHALNRFEEPAGLQALISFSGPLSAAAIGMLAVMLARKGTAGPNRFGDAPRDAP